MSGSNSSGRPGASAEGAAALTLTVHSMPTPGLEADDDSARRTRGGRWKMLLLLAVCAAPVIASYLAYFVIRPDARTNYSELVVPPRPMPPSLQFTALDGGTVSADALRRQWLLVVVSEAACDATCERHLWLQRQLREALGRERDRLDKVWLVIDGATPRAETLQAVAAGVPVTVLRAQPAALTSWLEAVPGRRLEDHLYVVDPRGDWMMRVPADPDPSRLKRDLDRLLRASAGWDQPGR